MVSGQIDLTVHFQSDKRVNWISSRIFVIIILLRCVRRSPGFVHSYCNIGKNLWKSLKTFSKKSERRMRKMSTFRTRANQNFAGPKSLFWNGLPSVIAQKTQCGIADYCFFHVEAIKNDFRKKCRLRVDCEKCPWYISYYESKSKFWGTKIVNSNRIAFSFDNL